MLLRAAFQTWNIHRKFFFSFFIRGFSFWADLARVVTFFPEQNKPSISDFLAHPFCETPHSPDRSDVILSLYLGAGWWWTSLLWFSTNSVQRKSWMRSVRVGCLLSSCGKGKQTNKQTNNNKPANNETDA